jgi:WD40-like Beta Propeller Repeat
MVSLVVRKMLWLGVGVAAVATAGALGASEGSVGAAAAPRITALGGASASAPAAEQKATASLTASRFGKGAAESRPAKIVVANSDGSGSRVLTRGWFSFVSPDGSQVAVMDGDMNYTNLRLELYASTGGAPTQAIRINCARIVWSPDSTKLACVEYSGGAGKPSQLRLIDAATAATTTLATGFFETQVSFSPDSTRLAYVQLPTSRSHFSSRSKLRVIDLTTHAITTARGSAVASPAWGPDAIAFAVLKPRGRNYTFNVAVVQADGSGFRRLTNFRPDAQLFGPTPVAWSADGKRLLAGMQGRDAWTARESYAVDPIRGGVRLIAHGVSPSALSRNGRYVIGQTGDAETTGLAGSNVVRVPWGGGKKRVLLRQAVEASFNG